MTKKSVLTMCLSKGKNYKKSLRVYLLPVGIFALFLSARSVFAHSGTGPPFAMVNEKFAKTNPLSLGTPSEKGIEIPQDIAPTSYLIDKPVMFSVDTTQLGIDDSIAAQTQFRWTFSTGANFKEKEGEPLIGTSFTKTFTKIGSHLVTIEIKTPQQDFSLIDTILIDILPHAGYSLPHSKVFIESPLQSGKSATYTNTFVEDGTKYLWDFTGNAIVEGKIAKNTYKESYFYSPMIARVVDKNGFVSDTGIIVVGDKGTISYSLLDPNAPEDSLRITKSKSAAVPILLILGINIIIITFIIFLFFISRKKRKSLKTKKGN